jgi:5-methylcytosine-specific restriction endonuclease McrA
VSRKTTGERELFAQIWNDRPHFCETCGVVLSEAKYHNFDHIIPKGRRPDLRLEPSNIRLVCLTCHTAKHTGGRVTSYIGT